MTDMALTQDIADFTRRDITMASKTKPVLVTGIEGPAVLVMHEVFGFTPTLARLCRWIAQAGFRVYAPVLCGSPDATNAEKVKISRTLRLCISREFNFFAANRSSPVTDWLRQLSRLAHQECGGPGVGAIGLRTLSQSTASLPRPVPRQGQYQKTVIGVLSDRSRFPAAQPPHPHRRSQRRVYRLLHFKCGL